MGRHLPTVRLLIALLLVACALSAVGVSSALADSGQQLGSIGNYGEVFRGGGFDTTAYDKGKYDKPLTPGKFIDPVGFAVDTQDTTMPDDTAVYVLDRVSDLPLNQPGYQSSSTAVTKWRLQKLNDQGGVVGTDIFTLPADDNNYEMLGLAVDPNPSDHAVYALLVANDQNGNDPDGVAAFGVEYAAQIIGWTTTPTGSGTSATLAAAPGLSTSGGVAKGLAQTPPATSYPTPGVLSASDVLDPEGNPAIQDPQGLALDQVGSADYLAVQSADDSGHGAQSGIAQVCASACVPVGAIAEQWSAAALNGLPNDAGESRDLPSGISTVPAGNGAASGDLLLALNNNEGDGNDNLDVAEIPPSLPTDGSGASILLSSNLYDQGDGVDGPIATGPLWPRGGDPSGGEGTDYLPSTQLATLSNGLDVGEFEPNTTNTSDNWNQLNPGLRLLDPADAGGLLADADAALGINNTPLPPDTAIFDTLGNATVNTSGATSAASACNLSDPVTAASKTNPFDGQSADNPDAGANPAVAAGADGAVWLLTRGTDSSPQGGQGDGSGPAKTDNPTGGRELIELAPTSASSTAAANPCPAPSGTFTMADGSGSPQPATTPLQVAVGDTVNFDASSIDYLKGEMSAYEWSFGDGDTSVSTTDSQGDGDGGPAVPTASEQFNTAGTYTVELDAYGDYGEYTETATVTVGSGGGGTGPGGGGTTQAPTAAFTLSPASVPAGTPVNLDASATTVPSGVTVTHYLWDFGDFSFDDSGTSPTDSHVYSAPGLYVVTLKAVGSDNYVSSPVTETVTVTPAPVTSTPATPTSGGSSPSQTPTLTLTPGAPHLGLSVATTPSHGAIAIKLSCPKGQTTCTGTVAMQTVQAVATVAHHKRKPLVLGHKSFTIAGGRSTTVRISLSSKAMALLKHEHLLKVVATIAVHNPQNEAATNRYRIALHAPKAPRHRH